MMKTEEIRSKVQAFLEKCSKQTDIDPNQDIFTMGFANSLFAMQMVMFIEKEFDISIDNQDLGSDELRTVNGICQYITDKTQME